MSSSCAHAVGGATFPSGQHELVGRMLIVPHMLTRRLQSLRRIDLRLCTLHLAILYRNGFTVKDGVTLKRLFSR